MKRVDALLADYGSYHRTRGNFACHAMGVPLIVFGIFSFLRLIQFRATGVTAAEALIAAAFVFYAALDLPLALALLVPETLLDLAARAANSWKIGLAAFIVGWIFQGIGHARFEKKAPAFLRNLVHLLIGPLFLVNELLGVRPVLSVQAEEK